MNIELAKGEQALVRLGGSNKKTDTQYCTFHTRKCRKKQKECLTQRHWGRREIFYYFAFRWDAEKQNPFTCSGWVSSKRYPVLCLLVMCFLSRSFSCRVFFHRRPLSGDEKSYPPPRSLRLERSERWCHTHAPTRLLKLGAPANLIG